MNNKRYHVTFTGQLVAGVNKSTARANLILDLGLTEEQANVLLHHPGALLKRLGSYEEALCLASGMERAGVICTIEDRGSAAPAPGEAGESALISALRRYVPAMRRRA